MKDKADRIIRSALEEQWKDSYQFGFETGMIVATIAWMFIWILTVLIYTAV